MFKFNKFTAANNALLNPLMHDDNKRSYIPYSQEKTYMTMYKL